jgi:sugar O-acyltransferase (sialic acid O-acetyltransferase NeuD family)
MIYILGAGGLGREVLNIYIDAGRDSEVAGFLEENCQAIDSIVEGKPVQDVSILNNLDRASTKLICAIGTPLRKRLIDHTRNLGFDYDTIVHPKITKSQGVVLGEGIIISAANNISCQITMDDYVILNGSCTLGHDVRIGKYTTISLGVLISGRVSIGDKCFIGVGAVIVDRVKIGNKSFIGAGAVVTEDIPDNVLAYGVPARPVRKLSEADWQKLI